jgi:hypothetical protein
LLKITLRGLFSNEESLGSNWKTKITIVMKHRGLGFGARKMLESSYLWRLG